MSKNGRKKLAPALQTWYVLTSRDQLLVRTDGRKSKEIAVPVSLLDVQRRRYSSSDPKVILDNAKDI